MARLRLFGPAREAAGASVAELSGEDVAAVLEAACARFGDDFAKVLVSCAVWVNGEPAERDQPLGRDDEIALLPPVSGG